VPERAPAIVVGDKPVELPGVERRFRHGHSIADTSEHRIEIFDE
jgi:hypothetical protein